MRVFNSRLHRVSPGNALAFLALARPLASIPVAGEDVPLDILLTPGMRVRILAPDISPRKFVGTINRVDDQPLTIDVQGRSEPVSILREKIIRLDVNAGRRSRWVDKAIVGAIGAAAGAFIGAIIPPSQHWNELPATRYRLGFAPRLDRGLDLAIAWTF